MSALILVADADPFNLRLLSDLCASSGHEVIGAIDGGAVLDAVARDRPDLVLLDAHLPGVETFEVIRILKEDEELAAIPVVVVTEQDDVETRRRAMELGAEDYVTRPFRVFEVQQRIRNALRLQAARTARFDSMAPRVDIADGLTGTGTFSQLHLSLEYEYTRAVRYRHALTCMSVCFRNLAEVGTAWTSSRAETALVELANGLRRCIRVVDHLFRSGSDEFALLLPETGADGARIVLRRIQEGAATQSLFEAPLTPAPDVGVAYVCFPETQVREARDLLDQARARARATT
jgi:two-component system, cell cycle response regulator